MKFADRVLRAYRARVAVRELPRSAGAVFDIGCDDGWLLDSLPSTVTRRDGCDPLAEPTAAAGRTILRGFFPAAVESTPEARGYDAVIALATFEHFNAADLQASSSAIASMLNGGGRLIVTVPHPLVDKILHLLMFLRIIDGQEAHQHHGFDPRTLADYLPDLRLVKRRRFQLGLNYLFVFEPKAHEQSA